MKILIALNHPAHYYLFKYISKGLQNKGHQVNLVIKDKDILEKLLICEGVPYLKISEKKKVSSVFSIILKGFVELIQRDFKLLKVVNNYNPDIMLGTDIAITHVGKLKGIPSIVFNEDDYEINRMFCKASYPFAYYIIAPEYTSVGKYTSKKIGYNGIQKMSYLNPKYYLPNFDNIKELDIKHNEKYFIIRLVSLTSGHDIEGKHKGINKELLIKLIDKLEKHGKVFITSECKLANEFKKYQIMISPNKMHDVMAFSSLFIGDSQTMCAEAGILGTPFIRFSDFVGKIEYLNDLENNYKLGWGVKTNEPEKIFNIINELFLIQNFKKEWQLRKDKPFNEKIDLTGFSIWFVENYPESVEVMKKNPEYQLRFK